MTTSSDHSIPHAIAHFAIVGWLLALTFAVTACGSDDDANRPPRADISVESVGEGWRVVNVNGIACVERSWAGYRDTEYAISCVKP